MNIEVYNRVKETPSYQVERTHMKDLVPDKKYMLLHVGVYQSRTYGETAYADILYNEKRYRLSLPRHTIGKIDKMSHDMEAMRAIHDGKCDISLMPCQTKAGNTTYAVSFHERATEK